MEDAATFRGAWSAESRREMESPARSHGVSQALHWGRFLRILLLVVLLAEGGLGQESTSSPGCPIVLTQLPKDRGCEARAEGTLRADYGDGARLVLLAVDGSTRVLTDGFHSAADPVVSFDATRVLFAGKQASTDVWNIYEMKVDGSNVRQITRQMGDCRNPDYQSSLYTIKPVGVPSVPEYHITFVASDDAMNEYGGSGATSLYSCKLDGTAVRRLTFNLSSDLDPCILPDGRLVFASWQRARLDHGPAGFIGLLGINIDGSDYAPFTTGQGKRVQHMPCVTPRGLVIFVEADTVGWDGAGSLGSVTLRRPLHSYRTVIADDEGLFHSPSPLPDGRILVSRRSRDDAGTHGICTLDPADGKVEPVFDDPQWHDIQAKAVTARPEPDGRATAVPEHHEASARTGKLYCLNAYTSDLGPSWLPAGAIQRVRVLEGVPVKGPGAHPASLAQRRILGDVPVEKDGSFNVEIPANTPIELQILDADGMALRSCGWVWAKDYARQGCIGCHEDPELTPENIVVDAVKRPSIKLTLAPQQRRTVDFRRDVMPIIAAKCVGCHGQADAPIHLTADLAAASDSSPGRFNRSYQSLLAPGTKPGQGKHVHSGAARKSPLIWRLYGRNTSRPWDGMESVPAPKKMPPAGAPALTEDEKRTFVEWIDMGALWDGLPAVEEAAPGDRGGR